MHQPLFLHIAERLEGFITKLPASIQKPILQELTPLKELFLKQRAPRLVLTGSHKSPLQEVFAALFAAAEPGDLSNVLMEVFRWQEVNVGSFGSVTLLDARGADDVAMRKIEEELQREPADLFLHIVDGNSGRPVLVRDVDNLAKLLQRSTTNTARPRVIGVSLVAAARGRRVRDGSPAATDKPAAESKLQTALSENATIKERLVRILEVSFAEEASTEGEINPGAARLMALIAEQLPNEARIEMIRISRDRVAQIQMAQTLVKSTAAICSAVGAQPIPLADLPILTTLQLMMVSGIMHISGREKTLRAATEFVGALGVNVGAGMVLREGARAVLKFFPGWGNVVCGMVAGAGTYALGRASIVYFIEGFSLKEARRIYLTSRNKRSRPKLLPTASN
ncbi:MAG: hypothetical protein M3032_10455 [Verrucomicrobiota bacterium]|nr:hypothetical protein [Verrucomicrobiota bacterium]